MEQNLDDLSGGERQRVAIAARLSKDADIYLLDEPSAHLDVEQRVLATSAIRRYAENHDATAMVIDHDIYTIDLLSDRLLRLRRRARPPRSSAGPPWRCARG